jgi:branched-chain amino acid transport system substrate-binding protein
MRYRVAAIAVSVGLVVAGCGTSGSKSSTSVASAGTATTGGTTSASSSSSAPATGAPAGVGLALKFTGGTAGAAKSGASPITLGYVGQQGGTPSYPEALVSAEAAVKYVNDNLGGVDGHPLAIKTCNIVQTEQQGQECGQQFLNSNVPLVINGGLSNGGQSFYDTLHNQVPVIEGIGGAPVDSAGKSTLVLSAGVLGVGGSMTRYIEKRYHHPKTVSIVAPNVAITQLAVKELSSGLKQDGTDVTAASFAPDASDLLTPLIAAKAKTADVLAGIILTPQCPTFINSVKQLGRTGPVVVLDLCINASVKKALGTDYPKWDYLAVEQIPYASNPSPDVASYLAGLHKYAGPSADPNDYAGTTWSSILAAVRIMNKLGAAKVTRANMLKAVAGFKAPGFITPASDCGAIPSSPGLCSPKLFFYHYNGNGNFTDEAPGGA